MNSTFDPLCLRKVDIAYVTPPVCEYHFSSSGFPSIALDVFTQETPKTGSTLGGIGHSFLTWNTFQDAVCTLVYYSIDDSAGSPYNVVSECVPPGTIALCSPGVYKISVNVRAGDVSVETGMSDPIFVSGEKYSFIELPTYPQTLSYNLYKSTDYGVTFALYWTNFASGGFEVCVDGCFKISQVGESGETALSDAICTVPKTCPETVCPSSMEWLPTLCSCVPCSGIPLLLGQKCETGYKWDALRCRCVAVPGGGGGGGGNEEPPAAGDDTIYLGLCLGSSLDDYYVTVGGYLGDYGFAFKGEHADFLSLEMVNGPFCILHGEPPAAGVYPFTVSVKNGSSTKDYKYSLGVLSFSGTGAGPQDSNSTDFSIDYYDGLLPADFVWQKVTSISGAPGAEQVPPELTGSFDFKTLVSGGTPPYTLAIVGNGKLNDGLTFKNGVLSGSPTKSVTTGCTRRNFEPSVITIRATDSHGIYCEADFNLAVGGKLDWCSSSEAGVCAGSLYQESIIPGASLEGDCTFSFYGETPDFLNLAVTNGSLATVSGTPPAWGSYPYVVKIEDQHGHSELSSHVINAMAFADVAFSPTGEFTSCAFIRVSDSLTLVFWSNTRTYQSKPEDLGQIPVLIGGLDLSNFLRGGVPPYTVTIIDGYTQPGFQMIGNVYYGSPTTDCGVGNCGAGCSGVDEFTVRATDSLGASCEHTFRIDASSGGVWCES